MGRRTSRAEAMAAAAAVPPKATVTAHHAAKLATVTRPAADPSPVDGDTQAATTFAPGASARSGLGGADTRATTAAETGPVIKGFATALQELRLSDPADRLAGLGKHHHVSEVERRRKAHKIEQLAPRLYQQKGGVLIVQFYDASNEVSSDSPSPPTNTNVLP